LTPDRQLCSLTAAVQTACCLYLLSNACCVTCARRLSCATAGEHLASGGDGGELFLWKANMELLKEDETHWGRCILRCGSRQLC